MTAPSRWARVSPDSPCPVCGKPDWCLRARAGDAVLCPRVESGRRCGDAGWLHRLANADARHRRPAVRRVMLPPSAPPADLTAFADGCRAAADPSRLAAFARSLGLSADALTALRVGWSAGHRAWTFPMTDPASGRVTGVRLRRPDGFKFAVRGGRDGLFLSAGCWS